MSDLEVVGPDRAPALAALKAETFVATFAEDNDPGQLQHHVARELSADAVRRTLEDPESTTWWLVDDGEPVAYLKVNRGRAQTEPGLDAGLEIEQVYVREAHHGRGHGRRLLEHAIAVAEDEGHEFVWLGVWERNERAIAVYERLGFVAFGDHTFLFGAEEQRDVLMRRDLS